MGEEVGELAKSSAFFVEPQPPLFDDEIATSAGAVFSSANENRSVLVVELTTTVFDPCAGAISNLVCINSPQLALICVACFTIVLMITLRLVFCCCQRRRWQKRVPDILNVESDIIQTRLSSIPGNQPPPRYSQIFDQDGISVFEEVPPDYETAQPDLLKSLPQNLSRTSSLATKEQNGDGLGQNILNIAIDGDQCLGEQKPSEEPKMDHPQRPAAVVLSVEELLRNAQQEVTC